MVKKKSVLINIDLYISKFLTIFAGTESFSRHSHG